jgi:hypothetical protein
MSNNIEIEASITNTTEQYLAGFTSEQLLQELCIRRDTYIHNSPMLRPNDREQFIKMAGANYIACNLDSAIQEWIDDTCNSIYTEIFDELFHKMIELSGIDIKNDPHPEKYLDFIGLRLSGYPEKYFDFIINRLVIKYNIELGFYPYIDFSPVQLKCDIFYDDGGIQEVVYTPQQITELITDIATIFKSTKDSIRTNLETIIKESIYKLGYN